MRVILICALLLAVGGCAPSKKRAVFSMPGSGGGDLESENRPFVSGSFVGEGRR